jgi:pimeloyl-ACP methyl ester carboxylesterase
MQLADPDRSSFADVNGTRLRLWHWGNESNPVVVMVHGAFDHGRMFDGIAPRVAALGYHVVAVDLRGHGDSGRLLSGNTWTAMNLDLALLARHLGSPVGFVSHSFGGGQSLCVAAGFPELVRWIVSIDGLGPPAAAFEERAPAIAAREALDAIDRVVERGPRQYPSREDMAERRRRVNVRMSEKWAAHLVLHGSREGRDGGFEWKFDPLFNTGVPGPFSPAVLMAQYRLVRCPMLLLTGNEPDTWNDLTAGERSERLAVLADVRHHEIAGAGHYVHLEQPDAVIAHISAFIDEVGR